MNNKGFTSMIFGLVGFFILILVIVTLLPYHYGREIPGDVLNWSALNASKIFSQGHENIIVDVTYRFVDFIGYSGFEIAKASVELGKERPDIFNPIVLLYLLIVSLLAPIAVALFKLVVIVIILIKEFIQSRKEKRLLKNEQETSKSTRRKK